jgi:DNA-binding response OmpR family regulator
VRVLLLEDEIELVTTLRDVLERERFVVDHADSLTMGREAAVSGSFDLVLLDRTLPDGDGLSLIPFLRRQNPGLAIIVMSASGEISDRVTGLDQGADDYLIKPFALEELFARIRAIRRRPTELGNEEIKVGHLVYDITNDEASVEGVRLNLPRRELSVLSALVKRRGRTVLREALEQAVFGFDDQVQSNTLDSHVSRLRKKLSAAAAAVDIHPIRGVGYLLRSSR